VHVRLYIVAHAGLLIAISSYSKHVDMVHSSMGNVNSGKRFVFDVVWN
jgi:hypothetical protein